MASKDDTALWLHNKLGSLNHLWSSSTIVSQYSYERLQSIRDCFQTLDSIVKVKFFLSLFHIPRRNLDEYKAIINEIIESTIEHCNDQWVLSMAVFMRPYWQNQSLSNDEITDIDSFKEAYTELKKTLKKGDALRMLPVECDYLYKAAKATYAELPQSDKHFSLIRLAKSAAVLQELKKKASNFTKNRPVKMAGSSGDKASPMPYLSRNMYKSAPLSVNSMNNDSIGASSSSSAQTPGFLKRSFLSSATLTGKQSALKSNVGIKLLDLQDQPLPPKEAKRKKKEAEKETKKRIKLDTTVSKDDVKVDEAKATDNGEVDVGTEQVVEKIEENEEMDVKEDCVDVSEDNLQPMSYTMGLDAVGAHANPFAFDPYAVAQQSAPKLPIVSLSSGGVAGGQSAPIKITTLSNEGEMKRQEHRALLMPRERLAQVQEMFMGASALTMPQKALIMNFVAGARDNPPENGPIMAIKLNEAEEVVTMPDGQQSKVLTELFFHMNFETGEFKKVKHIKSHL